MPPLTGALVLAALALVTSMLAGCRPAGRPAPTPTRTRSVALVAIRRATLVQATRVTYTPSPTVPTRTPRPTVSATMPPQPSPTLPTAEPAPVPAVTTQTLPPPASEPLALSSTPTLALAAPMATASGTPTLAVAIPTSTATHLAQPNEPAFYVYRDGDAAENNFSTTEMTGDMQDVIADLHYVDSPCHGDTDIQVHYTPSDTTNADAMVGIHWLQTDGASAGFDLSNYNRLVFCARGEVGGEQVTFGMGGNDQDAATCTTQEPYPDSSCRARLTAEWQEYKIDLSTADLKQVSDGFFWEIRLERNPTGATFYLDDIRYEHR